MVVLGMVAAFVQAATIFVSLRLGGVSQFFVEWDGCLCWRRLGGVGALDGV